MFFFFFDPLGSELIIRSEVLKNCYLDIFFEKLYRDKYINVKQITDNMTKVKLKAKYNDSTNESKKREPLSKFLKKLLYAKNEELPSLLFSLDNDFEKTKINFQDLNDDDKKAMILSHLLFINRKKNQEAKAKYFLKLLEYEENHRDLIYGYYKKQYKKHGVTEWTSNDEQSSFELDKISYKDGYLYYPKFVQLLEASSIPEIEGNLKKFHVKKNNKLFFRGHSDINYQLVPSIYRTSKGYSNENIFCEESLIRNPEEFTLCGNQHLNILKKMQHYGLPTRLLDISDSLLVGLYFAIENNFELDGELIVFDVNTIKYTRSDSVSILCSLAFFNLSDKERILKAANTASTSEEFNGVTEVKRLKHEVCLEKPAFLAEIKPETFKSNFVVVSVRDNRRISQQSGAFILPPLNINSSNNIDDFRVRDENQKKIVIRIPKEKKSKLLEELELFGITKSFIYPEIEEVAKYLKSKYY